MRCLVVQSLLMVRMHRTKVDRMEKEGHSSGIILRLERLVASGFCGLKVSELDLFTDGIGAETGVQRELAKSPKRETRGKAGATSLHREENRTTRSRRMLQARHVTDCPSG